MLSINICVCVCARREITYISVGLYLLLSPSFLQYVTLGEFYSEMASHEAALDEIMRRIRGDGLDPNISLDRLQAAYKHFKRTAANHVRPVVPATSAEVCATAATSLGHGFSLLKVNMLRLAQVRSCD